MPEKQIASLEVFVRRIKRDYSKWNTDTFPWFRGEPLSKTPLLPKLYRKSKLGHAHNENRLLQHFRMKAPTLGLGFIPDRGKIDEWLFLAQHFGLPTRLLDWTESALIALYFALLEKKPVVWMLDPVELNRRSTNQKISDNTFPLTWVRPEGNTINIGHENIRGAWETNKRGVDLPVAVHPTNIHLRMSTQRSCFTVHGLRKLPISTLVDSRILKRYSMSARAATQLRKDLRMIGVTRTQLFPDLEGLALDLATVF